MFARYASLIALAAVAAARPEFAARIPNGGAGGVPGSGLTCLFLGHNDCIAGADRNQFGLDFKAVGNLEWTADLCAKDSDGDGVSNGEEMGDPCCLWTPQNTSPPGFRSTDLSHPGDAQVPAERHACPQDDDATQPPTETAPAPATEPAAEPETEPPATGAPQTTVPRTDPPAAETTKPTKAAEATKPTKAAEATKPTKAAEATKPTKAAETTKPTKTAEATKTAEPTKAVPTRRPAAATDPATQAPPPRATKRTTTETAPTTEAGNTSTADKPQKPVKGRRTAMTKAPTVSDRPATKRTSPTKTAASESTPVAKPDSATKPEEEPAYYGYRPPTESTQRPTTTSDTKNRSDRSTKRSRKEAGPVTLPPTKPTSTASVPASAETARLMLVSAGLSGEDAKPAVEDDYVCPSAYGYENGWSIVCKVPYTTKTVKFYINDEYKRTERFEPYCLNGDSGPSNGNIVKAWEQKEGRVTVTCETDKERVSINLYVGCES